MFAKRVIPCLDVHRGRVVKGTNFLNLRDAGDPVACAKAYDDVMPTRRRHFGNVSKLPSGRWQANYWHQGIRHVAAGYVPG